MQLLLREFYYDMYFFSFKMCSISTKNKLIFTFSKASLTVEKLSLGLMWARRGQVSRQCSSVCISVLHRHILSSLGIGVGLTILPVSINKLWLPVLYLVLEIRSISKAFVL